LSDVQIGGVQVAARERAVLLLAAANRDPTRFPDPEKLDLGRDATGHLAFGRGAHYCAGAQLIRAAVTAATSALVDLTAGVESIGEVEWIDGFAIRGPTALPVVLRSVATN
jgi:cytochrome P450